MSKWMFAVLGLALGMAAVATADDAYRVFNYGSGAMYGAVNDPYSGPTAPGMRFGDAPQVSSNAEVGSGICQSCFGVGAPPCDPCWRGPCVDWKLIGWYSHWCDHGGHKKRCCASVGNCDNACGDACGGACEAPTAACDTCQ